MHVTIDASNTLQVDGRPTFLIGARHMPTGGTPTLLRQAGFNSMRVMAFGGEQAGGQPVPDDLDGLYFWSYLYDRADFTHSYDHKRQLRDWIGQVREHPDLLCYENLNEPTLKYHSDRFKSEPEDLAVGTCCIRELDPHHPIWLAHCCSNTVETLQRFNACLDVVGCNPYPVVAPGTRRHIGMVAEGRVLDCPDQSLHAVGRYTDRMMAVAQGRPVWMLIQAMANESWFNPLHTPEYRGQTLDSAKVLYPTDAQMRFMAFDAIISGARGLALAMYQTPTDGTVWADICAVVGELKQMHDILAMPNLSPGVAVDYEDVGFTIWDGVRTALKQHDDNVHLLAVNTAPDPARVAMTTPAVGKVGSRVIRDDFEPFAVKTYLL